jgi:hypothetical protein
MNLDTSTFLLTLISFAGVALVSVALALTRHGAAIAAYAAYAA